MKRRMIASGSDIAILQKAKRAKMVSLFVKAAKAFADMNLENLEPHVEGFRNLTGDYTFYVIVFGKNIRNISMQFYMFKDIENTTEEIFGLIAAIKTDSYRDVVSFIGDCNG